MQKCAGSQGHLPMPVLIRPGQQAQDIQTVGLIKQPYRGVCQSLGFLPWLAATRGGCCARASSLAGGSRLYGALPCQQAE